MHQTMVCSFMLILACMTSYGACAENLKVIRALVPITAINSKSIVIDERVQKTGIPAVRLTAYNGALNGLTAIIRPEDVASVSSPSLQCPADKKGLTDGFQVFSYELTHDMAASLSLWGKDDLSATDKVILYQFTWYKDIIDSDGSTEGRCGAGVILALRVSKLEGSANVSLPVLAASAQLGKTSITYKLSTFGLSGNAIDAAIPSASTIGQFDASSYAALMQSISQVQAAYKSSAGDLVVTPRPIALSVPIADPDADTRIAVQLIALRQIANGKTCRDARSVIPTRSASSDSIVADTYSSIAKKGCSIFDGKPDTSIVSKEADTLKRFGLQP